MRFTRHARVFRGQLDVLTTSGTLLVLLVIVLLHNGMVFTAGVPIELPESVGWSGTTNDTITLMVDARGQVYYQNQWVREEELGANLRALVKRAPGPVTLILMADRTVPYELLVRLAEIGRAAGVRDALLPVRPPRSANAPGQSAE
jgi:biopolymer transport protein ExbD